MENGLEPQNADMDFLSTSVFKLILFSREERWVKRSIRVNRNFLIQELKQESLPTPLEISLVLKDAQKFYVLEARGY